MATASHRQLSDIFHRMAVNIRAGQDIRAVVKMLSRSTGTRGQIVFGRMTKDLDQGHSLAEAMQRQSAFFPDLAIALMDAGERGGRMDQSANRLSQYYKALIDMRNSFVAAIAWPAFELAMSIFIVGLLILVLGFLGSMTGTKPLDLFGMGWSTTTYFTIYCSLIILAGISAILAYLAFSRGWLGSWPLDIARRIPLVGRTIEVLTLSRVAWALATAIEAGLSAIESIKLGLRSTQQWYYLRYQDSAEADIRSGHTLTQALYNMKVFPDDFMQTIETGELTGEIPESLQHLADLYDDEARRKLKALSTIGGVMVMLLIAVFIGGLVIYLAKVVYIDPLNEMANDAARGIIQILPLLLGM